MDEVTLRQAGIDYDAALARFVGKKTIYEKYLMKFLEDTHAQDALKAYEQQDYDELFEHTHALKGAAGTLGLTGLYDAASEIVNDLRRDEREGLSEKMAHMMAEQERICALIAHA